MRHFCEGSNREVDPSLRERCKGSAPLQRHASRFQAVESTLLTSDITLRPSSPRGRSCAWNRLLLPRSPHWSRGTVYLSTRDRLGASSINGVHAHTEHSGASTLWSRSPELDAINFEGSMLALLRPKRLARFE
jgi:hypothetical protein